MPLTSSPTSPARWGAAILLLVAAGSHIPLIPEHLEEAPYIGWAFILLSAVCIALAITIVYVEAAVVWFLGAAVCLAALAAYLASRTIGLPQIGDDVGNWTEPLGFPALASESLVVIIAGARFRRHPATERVDVGRTR